MTVLDRPHVVIVGAGFGGLHAVRALKGAEVRITVIDRHNYHLFQPTTKNLKGRVPAKTLSQKQDS